MFGEYKVIEVSFECLSELELPKDTKLKLNVMKGNVNYEFLMFLRSNSNKLTVMYSMEELQLTCIPIKKKDMIQ